MLKTLAASLLLTLIFEEGFALVWGLRGRRELGLVALINCLTNPPVVLLYCTASALWRWNPVPAALALEAAAILVEWQCCRAFSEQIRRPFLFALLANLLSFGAGCAVNFLTTVFYMWRFFS